MIVSQKEVNAVAAVAAEAKAENPAKELSLLELALVGGGIGETIL